MGILPRRRRHQRASFPARRRSDWASGHRRGRLSAPALARDRVGCRNLRFRVFPLATEGVSASPSFARTAASSRTPHTRAIASSRNGAATFHAAGGAVLRLTAGDARCGRTRRNSPPKIAPRNLSANCARRGASRSSPRSPRLGSCRRSPYAAANARRESFALLRRRGGVATRAVAWGAWRGAGMASGGAANLAAALLRAPNRATRIGGSAAAASPRTPGSRRTATRSRRVHRRHAAFGAGPRRARRGFHPAFPEFRRARRRRDVGKNVAR